MTPRANQKPLLIMKNKLIRTCNHSTPNSLPQQAQPIKKAIAHTSNPAASRGEILVNRTIPSG